MGRISRALASDAKLQERAFEQETLRRTLQNEADAGRQPLLDNIEELKAQLAAQLAVDELDTKVTAHPTHTSEVL